MQNANVFVSCCLLLAIIALISAAPSRDSYAALRVDSEETPATTTTTTMSQDERDAEWERQIGEEVNKIMEGPLSKLKQQQPQQPQQQQQQQQQQSVGGGGEGVEGEMEVQGNVQVGWTVAQDANATQPELRPRPPVMDNSISNLREVLDRLEMGNVNALAVQEAQTSSYASKRAQMQAMLAVPDQAIAQRLQERQLCEKQVKSLGELRGMLSTSIERVQELIRIRNDQATHHSQVTAAAKELTTKNKATLVKVRQLVEGEVVSEQALNGGYHFDPVSLRTQQPEDILRNIQGLATNLASLMDQKVSHADAAVSDINAAFACPVCEQKAKELSDIEKRVAGESNEVSAECARLAEAHRELDAADHEKVIALKKDLEDLESAEHLYKEVEETLRKQRTEAEHVAKKMVGFYQNIPRTL